VFKDITPVLRDPEALNEVVSGLADAFAECGIDAVAAVEARGFIFGACVAQKLGVGFIPIRKPGKLPCDTVRCRYELEYGADAVEMHRDAVAEG